MKLEGPGFYVLAGSSGCGKSTLLKCIAGLLPYEEGEILLNGRKLKNLNRDAYWEGISCIGQKPFILDGTLQYNITLQKDESAVDEKRLEEAIRTADLGSLVRQKPEGLQRRISAETLSKGERLKINIARAVYRKAGLLLLDEMTEGLDPQAEIRILEALKSCGEGEGDPLPVHFPSCGDTEKRGPGAVHEGRQDRGGRYIRRAMRKLRSLRPDGGEGEGMKNFGKNILLTGKILKRYAGAYIPAMAAPDTGLQLSGLLQRGDGARDPFDGIPGAGRAEPTEAVSGLRMRRAGDRACLFPVLPEQCVSGYVQLPDRAGGEPEYLP